MRLCIISRIISQLYYEWLDSYDYTARLILLKFIFDLFWNDSVISENNNYWTSDLRSNMLLKYPNCATPFN